MKTRGPLAFALALAATACSGTSATAGAGDGGLDGAPLGGDPYATATSAGGLHVDARTDPQPPPRGTFDVELRVADPSGAPVDGLSLDVVPWMPAMGHGSSIVPNVTAQGGGRYTIGNVSMVMPGDWELRTNITGRLTDHVAITITIP